MNDRYAFIDMLRAGCVIYVVGFWHLMGYITSSSSYSNIFTMRVTVMVLGLFVFLSGYLLNSRGMESGADGVKRFYIKRFLRVFPLYLMSIALFYLFDLSDGVTLLKAALLISMFYGPPPPTLWFITMIMVFYLIAPLLIKNARNGYRFWVMAVAVFSLMMLIDYVSPQYDPRILIYFPSFVAGVYLATLKQTYSKRLVGIVVLGFVLSVALSVAMENYPETSIFSIPIAIFFPMLIFLLSSKADRYIPNLKIFSLISYAGFVMYLIHRPAYKVMRWLYQKLPTIFDADFQIMLYFLLICLPFVIMASWLIQKTYDNALNALGKR